MPQNLDFCYKILERVPKAVKLQILESFEATIEEIF